MTVKTSVRFFNKVPVRARWDDKSKSWWYCSVDLIQAFTNSTNTRIYWNAVKRRNPQLSTNCKQLKLTAIDEKNYLYDCLNENGIRDLVFILPAKNKAMLIDWIQGMNDPVDEQSKRKAYELYENSLLSEIEPGTITGLQQIHAYLFEGLYDFAGKIRTKNISKDGFIFANCLYFNKILPAINAMPDKTPDEIIEKYIELNIAHPFMEGNGRATRIWLDHLFKKRIGKCVNWQLIDKKDYLNAMKKSPTDPAFIKRLIKAALTEKTDDQELFMKGIDYSYYYEEIEE